MLKTPCEYMQWHGLPVIRRELVKTMISSFGLNQKETAEKMGITPAAVSQYLSNKRGCVESINQKLVYEIENSAREIINKGNNAVTEEICRLCKIIRVEDLFNLNIIKR